MTAAANSDVIVVGGGLIGTAIAWRLAQRGSRVRVIDDQAPGGASRVAAGMLAPVTEADFGETELLQLNLEAAAGYPAFVEELERESGIAAGYGRVGALYVALDRDESEEVRRLFEFKHELGLAARWLTPSSCRELEPALSPACAGGYEATGESRVNPRLLLSSLREAAARRGVEFERATVESVTTEAGSVSGVVVAGEERRAELVVAATGSWSGDGWLPEDVRPPVRPVKGQLLRLAARDERAALPIGRIVRAPRIYMVPHADGTLIAGASVEEQGFDTQATVGEVLELLREAQRTVPETVELALTETAVGLRPGSTDNLPTIGRSAVPGLVLATGHYRNGVLLTAITADAVTAIVHGEPSPLPDAAGLAPARFEIEAQA